MELIFVPIFIFFALLVIAAGVFGTIAERKRRQSLAEAAAGLGLMFNEAEDRVIPDQFAFLRSFSTGSNRYAFNVLSGEFVEHQVMAFDFHYRTESRGKNGRRQTHHHYFSVYLLTLPVSFPELTISREGIFSKVAQALGYDDIDFESAEFSRTFCVRSKDKKFAYDVCNPQMMEYLLANSDLSVEIENRVLALMFPRTMRPEDVAMNMNRLLEIRARMPEYLFVKT